MLPIHQLIWHEFRAASASPRVPEPEAMDGIEQVRAYAKSYEWGGPGSALQLHHLKEISHRLRPGDLVVDLACGPGPILLELAALYPECRFIGVDLSTTMLEYVSSQAESYGLKNLSVFREDVRLLSKLSDASVDLVICTAALHHFPDSTCLRDVFRRIRSVLRPEGSFYMFDFGQLKSEKTRQILVKELSKKTLPIAAHDYDMSLRAAFPIDEVVSLAKKELPEPFSIKSSSFIDFLYFLFTPPRTTTPDSVKEYIRRRWRGLSLDQKMEHHMLRLLQRTRA